MAIDPDIKLLLGAIAIAMTVWAHIPYLLGTIKGVNKPHVFTWIIWSALTGIAAVAQFSGGAGIGAWVTAVTCIICIVITTAALRKGEKLITRTDWIMFLSGLSAIPLWVLTDDPLLAVIIVTLIDVCAVYPTLRKSWIKPHEENSFMYGFNIPRHLLSIASIQSYTVVTVLYPAALFVMNISMYLMLKIRRRFLMQTTGPER